METGFAHPQLKGILLEDKEVSQDQKEKLKILIINMVQATQSILVEEPMEKKSPSLPLQKEIGINA